MTTQFEESITSILSGSADEPESYPSTAGSTDEPEVPIPNIISASKPISLHSFTGAQPMSPRLVLSVDIGSTEEPESFNPVNELDEPILSINGSTRTFTPFVHGGSAEEPESFSPVNRQWFYRKSPNPRRCSTAVDR
jgi:hypothetical protein